METSPLICRANQWTGFYMIGTSVMMGFKQYIRFTFVFQRSQNVETIQFKVLLFTRNSRFV